MERELEDRERLLAEAAAARRDALAHRERARKLATRFVRRMRERYAQARRALEGEKERLAAQIAHFNSIRSEFHATALSARDRLAATWAAIETQQYRLAQEWTEANCFLTEQMAALDTRAAELAAREKSTADRHAAAEAEAAGLREEAAALEQRIQNARAALVQLDERRDRARDELLHIRVPFELAPGANADELSRRELELNREKGIVAALRSALELDSRDLDDRRRLVAEQLAQLAEARVQWQRAERQTLVEMEELARALEHRERALDAREARLIRADEFRREDAHDLWRLRLQLEAWQAKLTAREMRLHTQSEEQRSRNGRGDFAAEELAALRGEVERLAASVLELSDAPESINAESGGKEEPRRDSLLFEAETKAA